jgi:hypothetical protein
MSKLVFKIILLFGGLGVLAIFIASKLSLLPEHLDATIPIRIVTNPFILTSILLYFIWSYQNIDLLNNGVSEYSRAFKPGTRYKLLIRIGALLMLGGIIDIVIGRP